MVGLWCASNFSPFVSKWKVVVTMSEIESSSLIGYAILKASYDDERRTYIDNFERFVLAAVRRNGGTSMSAEAVSVEVRNIFGITIPGEVVRRIGKRAAKRRLLVKDGAGNFMCLTPKGREAIPDLEGDIVKYRRMERLLVDKLINRVDCLCNGDSEMKEVDWKGELKKFVELNSVGIIRNWRTLNKGDVNEREGKSLSREDKIRYVLSTFVTEVYRDQSDLFDSLVNLTQGIMLATLLDGGVGERVPKLDQLSVALDTSLILDLLDLQGKERKVAADDILALVHANGLHCFVFRHTLNEVDIVLSYVESSLSSLRRDDRPTGVLAYAIRNSWRPSDIVIFKEGVEAKLDELNISIQDKPEYRNSLCLDESLLEECLAKFVRYKHRSSLVHDVDSLSAIHRLRGGSGGSTMERARYLFVTANSNLVHASKQFANDNRYVYQLSVSFEYLATRLWLRAPGVAQNVPRDLLVAAAYAGLRPPEWVWDRVLRNIDEGVASGVLGDKEALALRLRSETGDLYMRQIVSGKEVEGSKFVLDAFNEFVEELVEPVECAKRDSEQAMGEITELKDREIASLRSELDSKELSSRNYVLQMGDKERQIEDLQEKNRVLAGKVERLASVASEKAWEAKVEATAKAVRVFLLLCSVFFICYSVYAYSDDVFSSPVNAFAVIGAMPGILEFVLNRCIKFSYVAKVVGLIMGCGHS